ncbi:hypothetical protein GALMADRAFT_278138 [Galerina marginata CBS 339.88]|uniref:Uncharacterized protein n=1 Tax=Galerina marginata (strain CBS 339.88) TaxID=685588 RepID=A0A067TG02_GALM3|nr:hypothetical protein GALMADRAFT_278138 [Galerina marginata CBS 339.88]
MFWLAESMGKKLTRPSDASQDNLTPMSNEVVWRRLKRPPGWYTSSKNNTALGWRTVVYGCAGVLRSVKRPRSGGVCVVLAEPGVEVDFYRQRIINTAVSRRQRTEKLTGRSLLDDEEWFDVMEKDNERETERTSY